MRTDDRRCLDDDTDRSRSPGRIRRQQPSSDPALAERAGERLPDQPRIPGATTRIYADAALVSAVSGYAVGWLTDGLLLVDTYGSTPPPFPVPAFGQSLLYDAAGMLVGTSPLPEILSLQIVSDTRVYDRSRNAVYDTRDGSVVWSGPNLVGSQGAVAGPYLVYPAGGHLVAARY